MLKTYWNIGRILGIFPWRPEKKYLKIFYEAVFVLINLCGILTSVSNLSWIINNIHLSISQICLSVVNELFFLLFGCLVTYKYINLRDVYENFLEQIEKIDKQLNAYTQLYVNKMREIGLFFIFQGFYICQSTVELFTRKRIPYNLYQSTTVNITYRLIVLYQIYYTIFIIWIISNRLKTRYDHCGKMLQTPISVTIDQQETDTKIIAFKKQYQSLNDVVVLFNLVFETSILVLFLICFSAFLSSANFILYYGNISSNILIAALYWVCTKYFLFILI